MTNIRHLSTAIDIATVACQTGRVATAVDCVRIARATPWGKAVPVTTLKRAIQSRLLVGATESK